MLDVPREGETGSHAAVRSALRTGGSEGNRRLTGATAAVLLVLLAAEGVTLLAIRPLVSAHVFIGMMLLPPVALKLAATGYRFARYYTANKAYRADGPPHPALRLLGPVVVLSTAALFATGVALVVRGPQGGAVLGFHKASFVVWFGRHGGTRPGARASRAAARVGGLAPRRHPPGLLSCVAGSWRDRS